MPLREAESKHEEVIKAKEKEQTEVELAYCEAVKLRIKADKIFGEFKKRYDTREESHIVQIISYPIHDYSETITKVHASLEMIQVED